MAKILLVSRCAWTLYNYRKELIETLIADGYTVVGGGAGGDGFEPKIEALGIPFILIPVDKKTVNPTKDLKLLLALTRWYRREKPDIVHNFTIKPVIYGSIAARLAGVPRIINTIPGLGFSFTSEAPKWVRSVVERLYRIALSFAEFTFFQNADDRSLFIERKIVRAEKSGIAPEWVNTERFQPPEKPLRDEADGVTFLMVARLLQEKGVAEFVEAARTIKSKHANARFLLLGGRDERNPRVIPLKDLERWNAEGVIEWLGETQDVRDILGASDVMTLPSYYREGTPRALMEAAAMGKPIITTDNVGCREVVANEVNGLLVPVRDAPALASAMNRLIAEPLTRRAMGAAGREKMLREFDGPLIVEKIMRIYRKEAL